MVKDDSPLPTTKNNNRKKGKINKIRNMKYQKSTDELLPIRNIQIITAQTSKADYEQPTKHIMSYYEDIIT